MKFLILISFLLAATSSFATESSVEKCVDDALAGARQSLASHDDIKLVKLYVEESGMLIDNDAQYLKTREELRVLCSRLYVLTLDLDKK